MSKKGKPRRPKHLLMKRRFQLAMNDSTWEQILYLADQEEMYVADYIRMVLKRHIKENME